MNRFRFIAPILLLIGLAIYDWNREMHTSEAEARVLGEKALARYCARKEVSIQNFTLSEIGPVGDFPWFLVYISSGIVPPQKVTVSINKNGGLDSSFFTEP